MHLVGFIIRIYHYARSSERRTRHCITSIQVPQLRTAVLAWQHNLFTKVVFVIDFRGTVLLVKLVGH